MRATQEGASQRQLEGDLPGSPPGIATVPGTGVEVTSWGEMVAISRTCDCRFPGRLWEESLMGPHEGKSHEVCLHPPKPDYTWLVFNGFSSSPPTHEESQPRWVTGGGGGEGQGGERWKKPYAHCWSFSASRHQPGEGEALPCSEIPSLIIGLDVVITQMGLTETGEGLRLGQKLSKTSFMRHWWTQFDGPVGDKNKCLPSLPSLRCEACLI